MRVRISYTRHAFKLPRTLSIRHQCSRSQCTLSREDATVPILDPANAQSRAVGLPIVAIQVFWTSCVEVGSIRGRGRDGREGWREKDATERAPAHRYLWHVPVRTRMATERHKRYDQCNVLPLLPNKTQLCLRPVRGQ